MAQIKPDIYQIPRFVTCLNTDPPQIGVGTNHTKFCATSSEQENLSPELYDSAFLPCARSAASERMMKRSGEYSNSLGIKVSCTVRVNGKVIAVRDGGLWRDLDMENGIDGTVEGFVSYLDALD